MSECELPQYYVCKEVAARKPHKCCECTALIEKGEKHLLVNACWDGLPGRYRQHFLCEKACEYVRNKGLNDDECLAFGELQEWYGSWIHDYFFDGTLDDHRTMWRFMLGISRRERKAAGK